MTVTWTAPADRVGLRGYLVAYRVSTGGNLTRSRFINDPDVLKATSTLAGIDPRCFVVEAIYKTGPSGVSTEACT